MRNAFAFAAVLGLAAVAPAAEPLDFVPADSLLVWHGRPLPDTSPLSEEPSTLQTLLELGTRITGRALDQEARLGVRIAEMFGLTIRYPHAFALIDARAKPVESDPRARRVDRLRFALVVQNRGQAEPFLRIIQKAVNEQTNSDAAMLVARQANGLPYQELRDRRLPEWSVFAWGTIGEHFVLAIGEDVWSEVAATAAGELPSISRAPWYASCRMQRRHEALIEIFVSVDRIRERLDPFVQGRASAFFEAWDAESISAAYWALGFRARALFCEAHYNVGNRSVRRLYADPELRTPHLLSTVPPEARYALYTLPLERFIPRFFGAWVAIQDPEAQATIKRIWNEIVTEHDLDVERDLLAHLGPHVVLHNDPPHPLRLPLAMTALVEIRDEPEAVRRTLETICAGWRDALARATGEAGQPPEMALVRADDGVWSLRIGFLDGLAWKITDGFIVSSWSPHALRTYLHRIDPAALAARPRP